MKEWFLGLEARERRILIIGGVIAVISIVYGLILSPLYSEVATREKNVRQNAQLLEWVQANAARATARPGGGGNPRNVQPLTELSRQARTVGLQNYLAQSRPKGPNGVTAEFRNAPFDDVVRLLGRLEADANLRVTDASVVPGDSEGTGNVRLTLTRAGS